MIQSYEMCAASVDIAAEAVINYLTEQKLDKKTVLKYRLSVEEALNTWIENHTGTQFTLKLGKRLGRLFISLETEGKTFNPFERDEEEAAFIGKILVSFTNAPQYSYVKGKNILRFDIPKKNMNSLVKLLVAVVLGIGSGLLLTTLLPEATCQTLLEDFVTPLYSTAFRLITAIAGPMVLLSVIWGICGIGDSATLGRMGKRLIVAFLTVTFALLTLVGLVFALFNGSGASATSSESPIGMIFEMLLDIVPNNIVSPFADGNTLQIIFIAVVVGISMLLLGKRVNVAMDFVDQANAVVQYVMNFISRLLPAIIYLILLQLILSHTFVLLKSIWVLLLIVVGIFIVVIALMTAVTSLHCRVSPFIILKKCMPALIFALTTASSSACFGCNMETCEKKLGIDKSLANFGIPLGMILGKTGGALYFLLACLFFAVQESIAISAGWLILAIFLIIMMTVSEPPVSGGGMVIYSLLFSQLGLSDNALAIGLSVHILFDFFNTALNVFSVQMTLTNTAADLNLLDKDVLRAPSGR